MAGSFISSRPQSIFNGDPMIKRHFRLVLSFAAVVAVTAFAADTPDQRTRPPRAPEECAKEISEGAPAAELSPEIKALLPVADNLFRRYMAGESQIENVVTGMGLTTKQAIGNHALENLSAKDIAKMSEGGAILEQELAKVRTTVGELETVTTSIRQKQGFFSRLFVSPAKYIAKLVRSKTGVMEKLNTDLSGQINSFERSINTLAETADEGEFAAEQYRLRSQSAKQKSDLIQAMLAAVPALDSAEAQAMSEQDRRRLEIYRRVLTNRATDLMEVANMFLGLSGSTLHDVDSARKIVDDSRKTIDMARVMMPEFARAIVFSVTIVKSADGNKQIKQSMGRMYEAAIDESNQAAERAAESLNERAMTAERFNEQIEKTLASLARVREAEMKAQGTANEALAAMNESFKRQQDLHSRIRDEVKANDDGRAIARQIGENLDKQGLSIRDAVRGASSRGTRRP